MSRMRAIETGRELLSTTTTGITAAICYEGMVLKRAPQFKVTTLSAEVTPRTGATPYVYSRDWPVLGLPYQRLMWSCSGRAISVP